MAKKLKYLQDEPSLWYIEWLDHCTYSRPGWHDTDDTLSPSRVATVGWVLEEGDDFIIVKNNICTEDGHHLHAQCILKSTIVREHRLNIKTVWE